MLTGPKSVPRSRAVINSETSRTADNDWRCVITAREAAPVAS